MIYFDHAATGGFKPDGVICAVNASLKNCANAGRGGHRLSIACAEQVYSVREQLADFFGTPSPECVAFTKNCTEALNAAIFGSLGEGDKVVTTVAEHNSVLRPLHHLKKNGVQVVYAPLDSNGDIDENFLVSAAEGARAVVITLASNVTGTAPDIIRIRRRIPPQTLLIADGAQACGRVGIDVKALQIDALCVSGHKGMLGIQGSGALVFSQRLRPRQLLYGGTGSGSADGDMPNFYPDRLEAGTLSYPAIISLGEGVLYLKTHLHENRDRSVYLCGLLIEGLQDISGVKVYSRANPYGIVAFSLEGLQSELVANRLSEEYSICVRGGMQCAPLMHAGLNSEGLVRASLSAFNNEREVYSLVSAIKAISGGR